RRRHTRSKRDWSSDVCSSDLQSELGDLFGKTIQTKEEAIDYGKKLQKAGAQNVIVSLGGEGAIFIDDDQVIMADSPKGKVKNTEIGRASCREREKRREVGRGG